MNWGNLNLADSEVFKAVEHLKNAKTPEEKKEASVECCKHCSGFDLGKCEQCEAGRVWNIYDPFITKFPKGVTMHSSEIYQDENGEFHYNNPEGSG